MLDLTGWQVFALLATTILAYFGGRLLGGWLHRFLYRRVLLTRTQADDRFVLRVAEPLDLAAMLVVWQVLVSFIELPASALAFVRDVGHIGVLVALAWAALRLVDTLVEHVGSRSKWLADQRAAHSLLPLARRITKVVLVVLVGVMILARLGYAVGPLLVLLAIIGAAGALAAHRPLENVLAAYALVGDHGIREGDTVTLDGGLTGTIEAIGLYSTRIRSLAGSHVIVPNRRLADAQIERKYQRPHTLPHATVAAPRVSSPGGLS